MQSRDGGYGDSPGGRQRWLLLTFSGRPRRREPGCRGLGGPAARDRTEPPGTALAGSPAELLEFAVGQVLREDSAVGALPVLLARLAGLFGCRAALAFQEDPGGDLVVLAAFPQQAGPRRSCARRSPR